MKIVSEVNIPSRPRTIWKRPCKHCPSAHFPPDPESLQMTQFYKAGEITVWEAIFPCAWRPQKMCKGVCDVMGITEKHLHKED